VSYKITQVRVGSYLELRVRRENEQLDFARGEVELQQAAPPITSVKLLGVCIKPGSPGPSLTAQELTAGEVEEINLQFDVQATPYEPSSSSGSSSSTSTSAQSMSTGALREPAGAYASPPDGSSDPGSMPAGDPPRQQ
jgi:hypothetical protein